MKQLRLALFLPLMAIAAGCTATPVPSVMSPDPTPALPVRAEAANGLFRLAFELDSSTWHPDEPITGIARLERRGAGEAISGCSPLAFVFDEVTGSRRMEPVRPACCERYQLLQGEEITSPLSKSGSIDPDDPDADFWRAFFEGPDVRLPAGVWEITANTAFVNDPDCGGPNQHLAATLQVTIGP